MTSIVSGTAGYTFPDGTTQTTAATQTNPAGSTGQVQYNNGGVFGAIASGTSGQVLTSSGNGSAPSWTTLSSGITTVISTVTSSTTLTGSYKYVPVEMTSEGQSITLPDATTLSVGGPLFNIDNTKGQYSIGIRDKSNKLIMGVMPGGSALISLKDTSTTAGSWSVSGELLQPGLTTTYTATGLAADVALQKYTQVALDNNTFIGIVTPTAGGFAAILIDNLGKTVSSPVAISTRTAANAIAMYKISATSAVLFYNSSSTEISAVVLSISGSSPSLTLSVGSPATIFTGWLFYSSSGIYFPPPIAQLTATSYVVAGKQNGSYQQTCVAFSISGTSVSVGSNTNLSSSANSGTIEGVSLIPLTSTTALAFYNDNSSTTYSRVISVSGTTCTFGSQITVGTYGRGTYGQPYMPGGFVKVSSTKVIFSDTGSEFPYLRALTISGTTITAGTQANLSSVASGPFAGWYGLMNNQGYRYTPILSLISSGTTNYILCNFNETTTTDTASSGLLVMASETNGTISFGSVKYGFCSYGVYNGWFSQGNSTGLLRTGVVQYVTGSNLVLNNNIQAYEISGNTLIAGQTLSINTVSQSTQLITVSLGNDKYVITSGNRYSNEFEVISANKTSIAYLGRLPFAVGGQGAVQAVAPNTLLSGYAPYIYVTEII